MKTKREVTVDEKGLGLVPANGVMCGTRFSSPPTDPLKVLHIFPAVLGLSAARPFAELGRRDPWETAGCLALWACALLGIGLCLI